MEIGMKEDMDVADEISLSNLVSHSMRNFAQSVTKCTYLQFMMLEGKDCDKNLHEGEHGCCGRNEIIYNKMILTRHGEPYSRVGAQQDNPIQLL